MARGTILHQQKTWICLLCWLYERQNMLTVRIWSECTPVLIPNQYGPFLWAIKGPPEHPAISPGKFRRDAIFVIFFTWLEFFISEKITSLKWGELTSLVIHTRLCWPPVIHNSSVQRIWLHCSIVQSRWVRANSRRFCMFSGINGGLHWEIQRLYPLRLRAPQTAISPTFQWANGYTVKPLLLNTPGTVSYY